MNLDELIKPEDIRVDGVTVFSAMNIYDKFGSLYKLKNYFLENTKYNVYDLSFLNCIGYFAVSDIPGAVYLLSDLTAAETELSIDEKVISRMIERRLKCDFGDDVHGWDKMKDYIYDVVTPGQGMYVFLYLLCCSGKLNENTVIFMNNMPGNMHPAMIVEMARLIIRIVDKLGCKFVGTSNSPDFVAAVETISKREEIGDKVNFYLGVEDCENPDLYYYQSLGNNIALIFESFNKSIDLMDIYGQKD